MSINYTELKAAMETAGYTVSEGDGWTASDSAQYRDYLYFEQNNVPPVKGNYGLEYTGILPEGFPGAGGDTPTRTLLSIAITGESTVEVGGEITLIATGTYDVAPLTEDVTATATWVSSFPEHATVAAGVVTGVQAASGTAITAAVGAITSPEYPVTVAAAPVRELLSIAITGTLTAEEGATSQLTATGTYSLAPLTEDITSSATWTSGTPANATVGASTGLVTGVAAGTSNITAALNSVTSPSATFTVTAP